MANFTERLTLLIDANASGALSVIKGFGSQTQAELTKLEASAGTAGGAAGTAFGTKMQANTLLAFAGIQAAVGGLALTAFAKSSVDDAVQLARANAGLAAEIKAVGAESGVTGPGIDALAQKVQATQVIFSTTTKDAAKMLLPLTEIRNEAGRGNDIFNRTIEVGAGVANVLGRELNPVVAQLGKALENPITGVLALNRAQIPLSQSTREQVLQLAKHGDLLGAQRTLLDDLSSRYVAAGAAIAGADPFQKFNVELTQFKTSVGQDLLPAATKFLEIAGDLLDKFGSLSGPIRLAGEAALGFALVGIPLIKIGTVLNSVQAASAAVTAATVASTESAVAETAARTGQAVADEALVAMIDAVNAATLANVAAQEELLAAQAAVGEGATFNITQMERLIAARAAAAEADAALIESETALSGALATRTAAPPPPGAGAGAGLLGSVGSIIAVLAVLPILATAAENMGKAAQPVDQLTESIKRFGETGVALGPLKTALDDIDFDKLQQGAISKTGTFGLPIIHQITEIGQAAIGVRGPINTAEETVANLDKAMAGLVAHGDIQTANQLFQQYGQAIEQAGGKFPLFFAEIDQVGDKTRNAASGIVDLTAAFTGLAATAADITENLKIEDSIRGIADAYKDRAEQQATVAGKSDSAIAADRAVNNAVRGVASADQALADANAAVGDSYRSLQDAQDKVGDSLHKLKEAQQDYDDYNSARGAHERDLQRDIILRRVVTTPVESEQKQLDLLQLQDTNRQKAQTVTDNLTSAQRGYADAIQGVADAQRHVVDAQQNVEDATLRVADAEQTVADAVKSRQKVHDDAARAIVEDENKIQEAYGTTIGQIASAAEHQFGLNNKLQGFLTQLDELARKHPYDPITRALREYIQLQISAAALEESGRLTPKRGKGGPDIEPGSKQLTLNQLAEIYASGRTPTHEQIYGYAWGGMVPGPIGVPHLAVVHGGERVSTPGQQGGTVSVEQNNHFYGDTPSTTDLDYANRQLGWRLARYGRN